MQEYGDYDYYQYDYENGTFYSIFDTFKIQKSVFDLNIDISDYGLHQQISS